MHKIISTDRIITDKGLARNLGAIAWFERPSTGGNCPGGRLRLDEYRGFFIECVIRRGTSSPKIRSYYPQIGDIITINGKRTYEYRL